MFEMDQRTKGKLAGSILVSFKLLRARYEEKPLALGEAMAKWGTGVTG
jgi:hypothetical protein